MALKHETASASRKKTGQVLSDLAAGVISEDKVAVLAVRLVAVVSTVTEEKVANTRAHLRGQEIGPAHVATAISRNFFHNSTRSRTFLLKQNIATRYRTECHRCHAPKPGGDGAGQTTGGGGGEYTRPAERPGDWRCADQACGNSNFA